MSKNLSLYIFIVLLAATSLVGCQPAATTMGIGEPSYGVDGETAPVRLVLAEMENSYTNVLIELEYIPNSANGQLMATFTPLIEDFHLYSKDLPLMGLNGVGRPTLLELTPNSRIVATGELTANVEPIIPIETVTGEPEPPVYPAGPITLSLPIELPESSTDTVKDEVAVTYMICSEKGCKAPVMGQVIEIEIPSAKK